MDGAIKKIPGIYPVTVADAVKMGDGTAATLPQWVNNKIAAQVPKEATPAAFNFSAVTAAIEANAGAEITRTAEVLVEPMGTLQYVGGIYCNGKIYCAPNTANRILVYDTVNEYHYFIGSGLGDQAFKYTGFALWDGCLYAIPRGVNTMLRINPVTDEVFVIELGTAYPVTPFGDYRDSHHYNGIISDGGYMYLPPAYASNKLLKINMRTFAWEELEFTSDVVSTWVGGVKHPTEDKIIFLSSNVFRIWNCEDDTYTDIVSEKTRACYDMVYDPRYHCFYGIYPNHAFALMLDDYTIIDSEAVNYLETGYGVSLGIDGEIVHMEGGSAYRFAFDGQTFTQRDTVVTEGAGSATPVVAGQAIAPNGDVYGIPSSGGMTRLKYEGVARRLPDSAVTSPFYGKY